MEPPIRPLAPGAPIGATDVRVASASTSLRCPPRRRTCRRTSAAPSSRRRSAPAAKCRRRRRLIELVGESVAGCSSVVACALVSYVLHGDVDARPLLEDEAAAVQNFLYLAAAASLSNLPSLYDAALDQLGQLLQVEFNTLIKEAYPEAAADISLIQPLGLTMIDGDVPNLDWLDGMSGTVKGPGGHFDDAELAAALEGSGCVTLLKMISAGELAFAEPQLTQSVFTLAARATAFWVASRTNRVTVTGVPMTRVAVSPVSPGRSGPASRRVPRPAAAAPGGRPPAVARALRGHRRLRRAHRRPRRARGAPARVQGPAARRAGSKKLKSHVAGKRAAEDSSAWLKRHRAAIDADEEAALDEATERLEALEAWPRKSDEAAAWPRRADPSEAAAAPAPAARAAGVRGVGHVARRPDDLGVPECAHVRVGFAPRVGSRQPQSSRWRRSSRHASHRRAGKSCVHSSVSKSAKWPPPPPTLASSSRSSCCSATRTSARPRSCCAS